MKDLLSERIKLEVKLRTYYLMNNYYRGKLNWLQYSDEVERTATISKALLDECNLKPDYRMQLENKEHPLSDFMKDIRNN